MWTPRAHGRAPGPYSRRLAMPSSIEHAARRSQGRRLHGARDLVAAVVTAPPHRPSSPPAADPGRVRQVLAAGRLRRWCFLPHGNEQARDTGRAHGGAGGRGSEVAAHCRFAMAVLPAVTGRGALRIIRLSGRGHARGDTFPESPHTSTAGAHHCTVSPDRDPLMPARSGQYAGRFGARSSDQAPADPEPRRPGGYPLRNCGAGGHSVWCRCSRATSLGALDLRSRVPNNTPPDASLCLIATFARPLWRALHVAR